MGNQLAPETTKITLEFNPAQTGETGRPRQMTVGLPTTKADMVVVRDLLEFIVREPYNDNTNDPVLVTTMKVHSSTPDTTDRDTLNDILALIARTRDIDSPFRPFLIGKLSLDVTGSSDFLKASIATCITEVNGYVLDVSQTVIGTCDMNTQLERELRTKWSPFPNKDLLWWPIIHVSGPSGSGKTTLGEKLADAFRTQNIKARVQDTDEFIQHHTQTGRLLLALEKKKPNDKITYEDAFNQIMKYSLCRQIRASMARGEVLVLTGLLDNFACEDACPFQLPSEHTQRIYLDVDPVTSMKQYYARAVAASDEHWKRVANGEYHIISSVLYLSQMQKLREWHAKEFYDIVPRDKAFEEVMRRVRYQHDKMRR